MKALQVASAFRGGHSPPPRLTPCPLDKNFSGRPTHTNQTAGFFALSPRLQELAFQILGNVATMKSLEGLTLKVSDYSAILNVVQLQERQVVHVFTQEANRTITQ